MYDRCRYTQTDSGSCQNQNFGRELCFYHKWLMKGRFKAEKEKYSLSTLPSYHDGSEEGQ